MPVATPQGFHTVTPYITVDDLASFVAFAQSGFQATLQHVLRNKDGGFRHVELRIGDSVIMAAQSFGEWKAKPTGLYLYVADTDVTYARALAAGGKSILKPDDKFYGDRNAGVVDPVGNQWWIATRLEDLTDSEIQKRFEALENR